MPQKLVTIRNNSNDLVLVGDSYLFPNETRRVPQAQFDIADKRYPNTLTVIGGKAPARQDVGRETQVLLTALPGVGTKRAKTLEKAGFLTVDDIGDAGAEDLLNRVSFVSTLDDAAALIAAANRLRR